MKRAFLTLAVAAAMTLGLKAQDVGGLMSALPRPAVPPEAPAPTPVDAVPQAAPAAVEREWLVLVFINGVNDLGIRGFADNDINEMEAVGSSDRMAVVVEYGILGINNPSGRNLQFQRGSKTIYVTLDADA